MSQPRDQFYDSGLGDLLIDPGRYPPSIQDYLYAEAELVESRQFSLLVEVGCMKGRYLDWCVARHKDYLGVDIVSRYVEAGLARVVAAGLDKDHYRLAVCSAANLDRLAKGMGWVRRTDALIFFPFNSFGNMSDPKAVLGAIWRADVPVLICTYQTNREATQERWAYYRNCGYHGLVCEENTMGVRFRSDDGLDTIAYREDYLLEICERLVRGVQVLPLGHIGQAYLVGSSCRTCR